MMRCSCHYCQSQVLQCPQQLAIKMTESWRNIHQTLSALMTKHDPAHYHLVFAKYFLQVCADLDVFTAVCLIRWHRRALSCTTSAMLSSWTNLLWLFVTLLWFWENTRVDKVSFTHCPLLYSCSRRKWGWGCVKWNIWLCPDHASKH